MTFNPQPKPTKQQGKKCQGTKHQGTKGWGCGKIVKKRTYGLGEECKCYQKWLLNSELGKIKISKLALKVQAPRIKANKEFETAKIEAKSKKSLRTALEYTKKVVHAYVRERDKGKPCVTCETPWNVTFQAGHCYKAETFTSIKFHLSNINGQCVQCNIHYEGRPQEYLLKLPKRIGVEEFRNLEYLASIDKQQSKVWNVFKLEEIRNQIKFLKK